MKQVLGREPQTFNIRSLLGRDAQHPLFHPHDVNHWIRWGSLGYMILCMPLFSLEFMRSCFSISFRVNTSGSAIAALKNAGNVLLYQKAYPHFETDQSGVVQPTCHFDLWSVLPATREHVVYPQCITPVEVQAFAIALIYLMNAFMLDLPVKYAMMLSERMQVDRNKEVAMALNGKLMQGAGVNSGYTELQVANYFGKKIRKVMEDILWKWNRTEGWKRETISTDHDAVAVARSFGLVPMPESVESEILRSVTC